MTDSDKCNRFYLNCKADLDAEYWYEELESNSPIILTSWATFVKHFRVKWLGAPPSSLLEPEPVISKNTDTATPFACKTTTTTATIPAPANTAAPAIYETTTTPERSDRVVDARHVTPTSMAISTQLELETTTATTATDSDNAIAMVKQQDNEEPAVGREEEEKGVEKKDRMSEREADRRGAVAGEQARTTTTQSTPARCHA
jgi:hypothetical protein